ncbi:amino acid permease [Weissella diestrammenae]|uniref:Amino acid permease n=1 Tax=Weissella diestrammenae TaxID=1162633 RepID=A0A7G9T7J4_9LACO|nr:amino acid permease [Weissella diestrammenae]MCM0582566.1 amino acid permease [Weissella diestrammenae]QNN76069.1 amino acid permease [Weissella diestrammenae]
MGIWQRMSRREDAANYEDRDAKLQRVLGVKDFLALGVGTIVSASIFTLPGVIAAGHAGPAVIISFIAAAIVAGLIAFAYAEMAAAMPFAGSAYSWINVLFGEFFGWIAGWALLAEYFIALAFVGSGLSANLRGLLTELGVQIPTVFATPILSGGFGDVIAVGAILLVTTLLSRGVKNASRVEIFLVLAKIFAIVLFLLVGLTAFQTKNLHPFIPAYDATIKPGPFGGWQGIWAGVSGIFLSYIGFDSIAANSAEAKNPGKTMPRGILGSLLIAVVLFSAVSIVLVGMFKYTRYANNAEPVAWALRMIGHPIVAAVVGAIAVVGMLSALIGMSMAGSRLIYSFGRDGLLPKQLGKLNAKHLPNVGLWSLTAVAVLISEFFEFSQLAQLISAGTLVAFIFVSLGIYRLRPREGRDLTDPAFKMPLYPILPAIAALSAFGVLMGLGIDAKVMMLGWFVLGVVIYFVYGIKHSIMNDERITR